MTEVNVVLSYSLKDGVMKRIPEMKYPRSFHTLAYLEEYKFILAVGGENNRTCEVFDLFTNKWQVIPQLNYPRANVKIYFDKFRNHLYAFFGLRDNITKEENYSDVVEILDFNDFSKGWMKVDYINKSEIDFKLSYCSVFPLSRDQLLIYGGTDLRQTLKSYAVYVLAKHEVVKLNKKMLDEIRVQARTSGKLSKIMSTLKTNH